MTGPGSATPPGSAAPPAAAVGPSPSPGTSAEPPTGPDVRNGISLAVASAACFGLSGSLASALMLSGWTAGAAVTARVMIAALVLVVPGVRAAGVDGRDRWAVLRRNAGTIVAYGVLAVAATQLCYFYAVSHLPVGVALLVEYTAPVGVVGWMWAVHRQRPSRLTVLGAAFALCGLPLLLDLLGSAGSGGGVDPVGVAWALAAMVGAAAYFVMSADDRSGLPPITLAASGLVVGAVVLGAAGLLGVLPVTATTDDVAFQRLVVPWWVPVLALGVVTAAVAYVTGIAATRRLGSRLASFVALTEVIAATAFAWLLLGQTPLPVQLVGAAVVLGGVAVVRLGEP
ncbi:MAG TPA: EamA family transporter [Microthrixaceae bacterium]|nr:EamA family transporter [Microthrixaceae bacterium]HMX08497.1 EamA family transporter [Microthrixaceae bacterium]HMY86161.1 EamA family transporter [Microthrixaceae bacterium]HNA36005.1 EamA family transporter [Microthrixaceae bacterium]HNE74356.1 EamA family transporter [Microthrixaceae bacterium]